MTQPDQPEFGARPEGVIYTPPVPATEYLAGMVVESPESFALLSPVERQGLALNAGRELLRQAVDDELAGRLRRAQFVPALGYLLFAAHKHQPRGENSAPDPASWQTRDAQTLLALAASLWLPADEVPSTRRDVQHVSRVAIDAADLDRGNFDPGSNHIILDRERQLFGARAAAVMLINGLRTTKPETHDNSSVKPGLRRRLALCLAQITVPEL